MAEVRREGHWVLAIHPNSRKKRQMVERKARNGQGSGTAQRPNGTLNEPGGTVAGSTG